MTVISEERDRTSRGKRAEEATQNSRIHALIPNSEFSLHPTPYSSRTTHHYRCDDRLTWSYTEAELQQPTRRRSRLSALNIITKL
ncbi:hypothetical protein [Scytonema millei]|uniref:Uncharacterized protein n=1 Tax=Scytonema millei VB511283 TaxID=1245923 RepID=A0A9X5E481_9CYAN|nr:hypothetical protein [Scytonema millei]NHC34503.1 hypothetical protein [Scytonema millei VB511283]